MSKCDLTDLIRSSQQLPADTEEPFSVQSAHTSRSLSLDHGTIDHRLSVISAHPDSDRSRRKTSLDLLREKVYDVNPEKSVSCLSVGERGPPGLMGVGVFCGKHRSSL